MKKKLLTAVLAAAMTMSALSPMAVSAADERVTLNLFIPTLANYSDDAVAEVEAALNEYLSDKYDFDVALKYTEIGNFENTINLAMTTDEVDVTCYFIDGGKLQTYAHNNQLLDITDYFENASDELKNTFTEAEIQATTVDGRMYGLPRKYQYGGGAVLVMNKDIVEEMGIDPASIKDLDSVGDVLRQVKEAHPELSCVLAPQSSAELCWTTTWDKTIGGTTFAYAENFDSTELKSVFEMDSFREWCERTHEWYQDGLIMSDVISNTSEGTDLVSNGAAFACLHNADIDPLDTFYSNTVVTDFLIEPNAYSTSIGNLQYGISSNSANPDKSFELLNILYTDPEFETILSYGIEGEHYVINEDGKADYPEGMDSTNEPYGGFAATAAYPDYLLLPVKASATVDDYKTAVDEWNNSVNVSDTMGFTFDTSEYADFITAYANLEDKYLNALTSGSIALDDVLPSIQSELEAIGFYEVLAEEQAQLDEFLANK